MFILIEMLFSEQSIILNTNKQTLANCTGIDITEWSKKIEDDVIRFSIWDFAGQTVYYNTHQVYNHYLINLYIYIYIYI